VGKAAGTRRKAQTEAVFLLSAEARHRRRQSMASPGSDVAPVTRAGSRKVSSVTHLTELLSRATSAVVTDYRGLTVRQLEDLRGKLRAEGIDYVVVKNTLARRAAVDAGAAGFADVLVGPVGLAIGYGDLSAPARILFEHFRSTRTLPLVAGLAEGQVLDGNEVRTLAELPSRDVLLSRLAAALLGPLSGLAAALDSPMSTFAATLEAYRDKLAA
jgi:large subunit ribosomal protein L10